MIPLMPFAAIGTAALLRYGIPVLFERSALFPYFGRWVALGLVALVIASPLWVTAVHMVNNVRTQYQTVVDPFLVPAADIQAAVDYVNRALQPDELVIATPVGAWMVNGRAADFQMSTAWEGWDTVHVPGDLPRSRYVFSPDYQQARYVIVDNTWRNWGAIHIPFAAQMLEDVRQNWNVAFESGSVRVYEATHTAPDS